MLRRKSLGEFSKAKQVVLGTELARARREAQKVHVSDAIIDYIYEIVKATRLDERVILGVSPRGGGEHLLYTARVKAYLEGRTT